jgi:hypothetical protein
LEGAARAGTLNLAAAALEDIRAAHAAVLSALAGS